MIQPGYLNGVISQWRKHEANFQSHCRSLDEIDLTQLSDAELSHEYELFSKAFLQQWGLPLLADAFSMRSEDLVTERLKPILRKRSEENAFTRYLAILTAPVSPSFVIEEAVDLLELVKQVHENPALASAIRLPDNQRMHALRSHPSFFRRLNRHSKKYFWFHNSYLHTRYLDESYFAGRLADSLIEKTDADAEITRMKQIAHHARKEKERVCREFGVDKDFMIIIRLIETFALWQDIRKKNSMIGCYYAMLFFDELCRRNGLEKNEWYGMLSSEFSDALKHKLNSGKVSERSRVSLVIYTPEKVDVAAGSEARELYRKVRRKLRNDVNDVRGTCASVGRTEGIVKIVLASKDLFKMEKGNILVSSMTRPELVPAMKKAAAIVTDEGGITSHAAIISRELGIPCVIGTKIATQVFKDGDFVEVNANHGIIRKVKT
ncbi:hypothetical protein KJ765_06830 [Candidatus Micrarchaeota archaeon]|nr:hypothetical protein [Candidatus Micrarchaeota archaeon]